MNSDIMAVRPFIYPISTIGPILLRVSKPAINGINFRITMRIYTLRRGDEPRVLRRAVSSKLIGLPSGALNVSKTSWS